DISSTNDALEEITLTNGTVKGDFVLANTDFELDSNGAVQDENDDNAFNNVDQANFVKAGLTSITATDFDGDIVLGRDNDIVDLGALSAAVNGDVTYNATLNDDDTYTAVTGAGEDTINITLDDNRVEANTGTDTAVTISTGAANDSITVDEANDSVENTTATINAGAGDDVIRGNDVSVNVTAGTGNDVIYVENTGVKALLNLATSGMYQAATPAAQGTPFAHGTIHFLAGREVTVGITTTPTNQKMTHESEAVTITAASGALTTLKDLNAAVVKAVNEDSVLSKIATAYVDENNNVAIQYLVDGRQTVGANFGVQLTVTDPAPATDISTAMLNEYRDFTNTSTLTSADVLARYNATLAKGLSSTATHEGSTLTFTNAAGAAAETTATVVIGDDTVTFTATGTAAADAAALANALIAEGYVADGTTVAGTVSVVTDKEISYTVAATDASTFSAVVIDNDEVLNETNIPALLGTDSVDTNANDVNTVNGGAGDDVIVLNATPNVRTADYDIVVWTGYSQGNDTIVHFDTVVDKLDFTSYLTGTIDAADNGSTSAESEIELAVTVTFANTTFTANSINIINFGLLDGVTATQTFEALTAAQLETALEADTYANTVRADTATGNGSLYQTNGVSVLVIQDDENSKGNVNGDTINQGAYKAFEVSYADATIAAGATDFTAKLIGSFDLGRDPLITVQVDLIVESNFIS
ncbi:hypothetical protein, partial [Marinomonas sp. 2405UD68-3]|uniref:hypothetical protein n=1 Tax=Marinomonas sp. 2405UD68-3 TaxID=3391835 RepID=UPI0039C907FB